MLSLKPLDNSERLGWSFSRYEIFRYCKRKYYFHYYSKYDYNFDNLNSLKNLKSVPLVTGTLVHTVMEVLLGRLLDSEEEIDRNRLWNYIDDKVKEAVTKNNFFEEYYKVGFVNSEELFDKVKLCIENFLDSDRFEWIITEGVKHKNTWIIEPPRYGETLIAGLKAYAKFDFLHRELDQVLVFDWKSGKRNDEKDEKQLKGYSCWASHHLEKTPQEITPIRAYLYPKYSEIIGSINEFHIQEFGQSVKEQTEEMYSFCELPERNIPKEKEYFQKIDYGKKCEICNFKEICWSDK